MHRNKRRANAAENGQAAVVDPIVPERDRVTSTLCDDIGPSIFHLEDGQLVAATGLKDDGCLDTGDPRSVREVVEGKVLQMLRVPHHDVYHDIVTACHEKSEAYLRHPSDVVHEAIDRAALVLGQFDHEQCFEP